MRHTLIRLHPVTVTAALLSLLLLAAESGSGQEKPAAEAGRKQQAQGGEYMGALELGKGIERELQGGAVHVYGIMLAAGQFLHVVVDQRGIDVVVKLFGPDGKQLTEVDSPNGAQGPESIPRVADMPGRYRLEVRSLEESAAAGRYEVRIQELRTATERDRRRVAALASLEEAKLFQQQSEKLYGEGKYNEATSLAERALAIYEVALGTEHPDVATALHNLAVLYWSKHDYARAELLYRRALDIREKALGQEHSEVATTVYSLAVLFRDKGDYTQAESLYRRAQAIYEKTLGPEHPNVALPVHQLALLHYLKGEYAQSETLFLRAIAIREKALGAEHLYTATTLGDLATLYRDRGDYSQAESLQKRALEISEKALGADHPYLAAALHNLAVIYQKKGDYALAEPQYQRALEIGEKALGPDHPDTATLIYSLALLYEEKGDYARSESLNRRALSIYEKALGAEHISVAKSLNSLAKLATLKRDYVQAELFYRRALAVYEKAVGAEHPDVAAFINNMARLYEEKADYAQAETLYLRSLAIREKAQGQGHPDVAASFNNLAMLYLRKRDYVRAEALFKRALEISEKALGPEHPQLAHILSNFAVLYQLKGNTEQAVALQTRGNSIREHNITLILTTGSESQKRIYLNSLSNETNSTISLHVRSAPDSLDAAKLAFTTVLRRKGRVLDVMSDQLGALRRRLNPQDQELLNQLSNTSARLAALIFKDVSKTGPAQHRAEVAKLEEDRRRLEADLGVRSAESRAQLQSVTPEQVQQAIPTGAALVEIVLYRPYNAKAKTPAESFGAARYVAYVLRREGAPLFVELGEAAVIDRGAAQLQAALGDSQLIDISKIKHLARALDERVMRPIRRLLGETREVFLSPDGALNLLPFGALVDVQNRFLLENYTFTYLTSGRDLLRLQVEAESKQPPVVVANPTFDVAITGGSRSAPSANGVRGRRAADFSEERWESLEYTADEAAKIKGLLPNARVLTTTQATEAALKQISKPRILHIATHGFFLENKSDAAPYENPLLRSGLILAGANRRQSGAGEDGVLTALEVAGMDLWGTELVVLSACETGVGDVSNGEGVYGLRRALVLAGAESQVLTLWQVQDKRTRDLMVGFYRRLQSGEGRTEALRNAQLAMLRGRNVLSRHPFFWAGFIQSGDWKSVRPAPAGAR